MNKLGLDLNLKVRMKRPTYRAAVEWLATNAGLEAEMTHEDIAGSVVVGFAADMFGVETSRVADDVIRFVRRNASV